MSITKKHELLGAFRLEMGKLCGTVNPSWAYNGSTVNALTTGHAIPFTQMSVQGAIDLLKDESIDGRAFSAPDVLKRVHAPLENLSTNMRYIGMDRLLYWMFGYEDGGSSPQDLGGSVYSHLFELDAMEREIANYRTAEQTAGDYNVLDQKNRFGVLGLKRGPNDCRYPFILCGGFTFSSKAGDFLTINGIKGEALREDRGNYSSSGWTFPAGLAGTDYDIQHKDLTLSLGVAGALVELGVSDFSASVEIPLFIDQDSESGLYNAMPVLSGQYGLKVAITIARHSVDTYLAYRESFTQLAMKAVYASGDYEAGLYFPALKISEASVGEEDVARHPIVFETGPQPASNPFTTELGDHDLIQNGPMFCIVKNNNSVNEMRRE